MKLRFHTTPHNLCYLSLICGIFSIFLLIMWAIKNFVVNLGIHIRCYHGLPYLHIWSTSFDFQTQYLWFVSALVFFMSNAIVQIMYFLGRNLNVSSSMGAIHSVTWLWLHSDAVSSYFLCMAAVSAVLSGCCISCSLCSRKGSRFQRGDEDSDR